jgi:FkbM family methyltransferase
VTLLGAIRRRISPLDGIMSATDYHRVNRSPALTAGTTRIAGRTIAYSDNNGVLHSAREIFRDEVYRFRARTDRPHIIDAGANIGLSVLYFKRMYPEATVIAFEPDAAIFALLQRNTAGLRDVELRQAAAWTEDTELTFYSEGSLAGSAELDYTGRQNATVVRAERLRDELEKRPVDFLKIDIEGAENTVLFDIEDRLDSVDHLFFEYHSNPDKPQLMGDLLNLVRRNGFRYTVNEAHGARLPFVERVEQGFDLQANVFCDRPA